MHRTFLGWDRPALHTAAERLVEAYRGDGAADMSAAAVVLPGQRAGRRLKELLVELADEERLRLVPPRITTVGTLPELFYEPERPAADPVVARRAWAEALRGMDAAAREQVFPSPPARDDVRGWESLAADVARLHRDVAGAGHRFADVARTCRAGALFFDDHERWTALADAQARYAAIIEETGRTDRELARIEAANTGALRCEHDLWLVGVVEMPAIVRRVVERSGVSPRVLVHAPAEEADAFDPLGAARPEVWGEREIDFPSETLRLADRPADQADLVLAEVSALGGRYAAEEIAIAVPDDEVVPYLEERLEAWDVPARSAKGTPLPRTATYRLLAALSDHLRSGGRWEAFAAVLRHPEIGAWLARPGGADLRRPDARPVDVERALTQADRFHADTLPLRVPSELRGRGGSGHRYAEAGLARARIAHLVEPLSGSRPLTAWPSKIFEVLARIHGDRTLSRERTRERRLLDTLAAFRRAALALARLPARLDIDCDAATAIDLVLEAVRGEAVPDDPDRASVELLGWLELPLDDAPVAFVTGFNEPFLPESITADVFLPDRLRAALGMLDNRARYARDACHLTALLHDRERVRLVAGRITAEGDPLHPSRLMLAAFGERLARRVQRFAEGDPPPAALPAPRRVAGESTAFRLPPEPELVREAPNEIPITAFRAILDDPYLWALTTQHELRAHTDEAREMNGPVFGAVAHEVLRAFGHSGKRSSTDPEDVARSLDSLLDREAARRFGNGRRLPAVRVQLAHLRLRLRAFARWQAEWAAAGWEIAYVEGRPAGEAEDSPGGEERDPTRRVPFDVDGEPLILRGRIDRIDHHPGRGAWAVFDYKTSDAGEHPDGTHRRGREKRWVDLQLPLYRNLACDGDREGRLLPAAARDRLLLGYIVLPRDLKATGAAFAEWSAAELEDAENAARDVVRRLREGRFAFTPDRLSRWADPGLVSLLGGRQLVAARAEEEEGA